MDFRRIPFQFSTTDPVKRQAELQKRFGLPVNKDKEKMHIDFANPGLMGIGSNGMSSASNSPRLQHRIPLFKEGSPEPMRSSVDSQGSPIAGRKPHVRVVPIEIEGDDNLTKRHRNLSGPPVEDHHRKNGVSWMPEEFASSPVLKSFIPGQIPNASRERTIPIQVEGVGQSKKAKTVPVKKEKSTNLKKEAGPKQNGCSPSKSGKAPSEPKKPPGIVLSLKKIEGVLEKLRTYHADVEKFTGTIKEKQYRYLDEMLTRLMLELDDVDTMGNEEVRLSRKAAVRQVQASVDLLEAKVTRGASEQRPEESSKEQDVEMVVANSQEENAMPDPDEDNSQVKEEPASTMVDQAEKTQDIEMESNAEDSQILPEASCETTAVKKSEEYQVMDVDVDTKPVVTTSDNSTKETTCNEQLNVTIQEVDSESSKESEHILLPNEPVVSLADCSVEELKSELELDITSGGIVPTLDGESKELKMDSDILPDTTDSVKGLLTNSCHVDASGKNISNLENATSIPNEHSKDLITGAL